MKNVRGKIIGIGVGPGDPELLTVKAVKALKTVDVICVPKANTSTPSTALSMVKQILAERKTAPEVIELVFPMTKDELELEQALAKNEAIMVEKAKKARSVAFLTLGDPMFYSTFLYLWKNIQQNHPEIDFEIVPGITSLTACAAQSKIPLAEKGETVVIIPSVTETEQVVNLAKHADTIVFMKGLQRLKGLVPVLERAGFASDSTVALVTRCTMPEETVTVGTLRDVKKWNIHNDYFSIAIIKKKKIK